MFTSMTRFPVKGDSIGYVKAFAEANELRIRILKSTIVGADAKSNRLNVLLDNEDRVYSIWIG